MEDNRLEKTSHRLEKKMKVAQLCLSPLCNSQSLYSCQQTRAERNIEGTKKIRKSDIVKAEKLKGSQYIDDSCNKD